MTTDSAALSFMEASLIIYVEQVPHLELRHSLQRSAVPVVHLVHSTQQAKIAGFAFQIVITNASTAALMHMLIILLKYIVKEHSLFNLSFLDTPIVKANNE
jgi:hypothetical protein